MAYSVYQLATLANAVYYKGQSSVGDWRRSTTSGNPDAGGFFAAVYGLGQMNVLAYRGTNDPWDPVDVVIEAGAMAAEVIAKGVNYVLCQHGMGLMEQQLKNMPEYHKDLGW